jgi:hypothetical protein
MTADAPSGRSGKSRLYTLSKSPDLTAAIRGRCLLSRHTQRIQVYGVLVTHQDECLSAGVTLVDGAAKLTSDLSNSASNAGQGVVNCVSNLFGGGCGR